MSCIGNPNRSLLLYCVVIEETPLLEKQLAFARCLNSIIVLTDTKEDAWMNGVLYLNKEKFKENHTPYR